MMTTWQGRPPQPTIMSDTKVFVAQRAIPFGVSLLICTFLTIFFILGAACGQPPPHDPFIVEDPNSLDDAMATTVTLEVIVRSMEALETDLKKKEERLGEALTEDQKIRLVNEINELLKRRETLEKSLETIATGVDLERFAARPQDGFDWQKELQELFGPIIQEIRKVTAHPREIEQLRSDIDFLKERLPVIQKGIGNIQRLLDEIRDQDVRENLERLRENWIAKEQNLSNQLAVAQYQLSERMRKHTSFLKSVQNLLRRFFKSRGRNLLLSLVAFAFVWLLFHYLYNLLCSLICSKKSRLQSLYSRIIALLYHIFSFLAATAALLLVLYISGDWVLLGLALIFLFGLAFAARQALPPFWEQMKLLLNLGPVKENERIVINGIPWRVQSLNFLSPLVNPLLKGGMIRLPLRDLTGLHSRPYHHDEPWFPCKENDWVILADGTHGRVLNQTPEMVEIILLGGSHKVYPTMEFLRQNPNNISANFRLNVTFGIDYRHQAISTCAVPEILEKTVREELRGEGYGAALLGLTVEFKEAGPSSLDLQILADFSGEVAQDYLLLERAIQRICVEASGTHGWTIPFTQLTLHTQGPLPQRKEPSGNRPPGDSSSPP
ncbi:MAG: hypothetical protein ACMUIL_10705 [bacterium]